MRRLRDALRPGDVVVVKGSNSSGMGKIVKALLASGGADRNMPGNARCRGKSGGIAGMLYNLFFPLADEFALFNLFRYLTFRTGGALMTALFLSFLFGPAIIRLLKRNQPGGQPIRDGWSGKAISSPRRARRPWAAS